MSDGAILRHAGSNRNDAPKTGLTQFKGGTMAGAQGGGYRRHCMGCNQFRPQSGGNGKKETIRWRCGVCVEGKACPSV